MKLKIFVVVFFVAALPFFLEKPFEKKGPCVELPSYFDYDHSPWLDMVIDNKHYAGLIAFSKFPLTGKRAVLKTVSSKIKTESALSHNGEGDLQKNKAFIIPEVGIAGIKWKEVLAVEDELEEEKEDERPKISKELFFAIGRPFLEKLKLFIDFDEERIFVADSIELLQKEKLFPESCVKIPIEKSKNGEIIGRFETDFGSLRLALYTCYDRDNFIKSNLIPEDKSVIVQTGEKAFISLKLQAGEADFGEVALFPKWHAPAADFDGYLGLDFLSDKKIYIDYPNFIYIAS